MRDQHTVLLGSAGTGTAFGAASALRRYWSGEVRIIAMDVNPRHLVTTSLLSDAFEQVPPSASSEFAPVVSSVLRRYQVDTYLPLLPAEIQLAAELKEKGEFGPGLLLLTGSSESSAVTADKWRTSQWLASHGIAGPKTTLASHPFAADQYFLKPRFGTGSRGVSVVNARALAEAVHPDPAAWVVQEICQMPEVTVDAFFDPASDFSASIARERIEIKSGVTTKARLFSDPKLAMMAMSMAQELRLAGSFCFQVMRRQEEWVVTDINPRPGAATAMCAQAGNDFFAATFARAWGQDYSRFFRPLSEHIFVTRQYAEFITV